MKYRYDPNLDKEVKLSPEEEQWLDSLSTEDRLRVIAFITNTLSAPEPEQDLAVEAAEYEQANMADVDDQLAGLLPPEPTQEVPDNLAVLAKPTLRYWRLVQEEARFRQTVASAWQALADRQDDDRQRRALESWLRLLQGER